LAAIELATIRGIALGLDDVLALQDTNGVLALLNFPRKSGDAYQYGDGVLFAGHDGEEASTTYDLYNLWPLH